MDQTIQMLESTTPEAFIESLTKEPLVQEEKDVIKSFRNFHLTDPVVNTLLHYMFFIDHRAPWHKLSKMAQFFSEHHIDTAVKALETIQQLQQYEAQLDEK